MSLRISYRPLPSERQIGIRPASGGGDILTYRTTVGLV
jgi:hypothetical protein